MGKQWVAWGAVCLLVAAGTSDAREDTRRARERPANTFLYRGRVLPNKYKRKIATWERQDARMRGWSGAYKTKSRHYKIETNVPRFIVELEIKPFLDQLYKTYTTVFRQRFGLSGRGANGKLIRIYHGYEDYARLAKGGKPIVLRSNPGFIVNGDELVVFYEETCPEVFYGTMFHEGAHQFVQNLMPGADLPLWLDEALACMLESCVYSRREKTIDCGVLPPDRLHHAQIALKGAQAPPGVSLPEHLFMNRPKTHFRAQEYALAWSFVHFLTHCEDGRYRKKFARFLKAMNGAGQKPVRDVFKRSTGIELAEFETGWQNFVLSQPAAQSPVWIILDVSGDATGVDLRTDDRVVSIDGEAVGSFEDFERLWTNRPSADPAMFRVVRCTPGPDGMSELQRFVDVTVTPTGPLEIEGRRSRTHGHSLKD